MTVGENIKRIRKEQGLTQKQLGELCIPPIAESTIRRYELGKLNPKYQTLQKIAKVLKTHPLVLNGSISEDHASSINSDIDTQTALYAILRDIYGSFDEKQVHIEGIGNSYYYVLGKGENAITITDLVFNNIYEEIIKYIKATVKALGKTENEEIRESKKALLNSKQVIENFYLNKDNKST